MHHIWNNCGVVLLEFVESHTILKPLRFQVKLANDSDSDVMHIIAQEDVVNYYQIQRKRLYMIIFLKLSQDLAILYSSTAEIRPTKWYLQIQCQCLQKGLSKNRYGYNLLIRTIFDLQPDTRASGLCHSK